MQKELGYIKSYTYTCFKCKRGFDSYEKIEKCPECGCSFDLIEERWCRPSRSSRVYYYQCIGCKREIENDNKNEQKCPFCGDNLTSMGFAIRDFERNSFLSKLKRFLL